MSARDTFFKHRRHRLELGVLKSKMMAKQEGRCVLCGFDLSEPTVEHLMPRSRGGSDKAENLAMACHACNNKRGSGALTKRQLARVLRWYGRALDQWGCLVAKPDEVG